MVLIFQPFYLNMSEKQCHNRSLSLLCLVKPGSHDAKNMKHSCCVLLQAIRCYRLPLEKYRLQRKRRIKPNLALNKGRKECGCVFSSCRSALMQHAFRPKNFTPVASSSLWDPSLSSTHTWFGMSACVCECIYE